MSRDNSKNIFPIAGIIALVMGLNITFAQGKAKNATMFSPQKIIFTDGKWKDIAAKAKKSGKYIFADAYTSWCAPCRQLKNVAFREENAAAYYNRSFIKYTVDMEESKGETLAGKWEVTAYPALPFFHPWENGNETYRLC